MKKELTVKEKEEIVNKYKQGISIHSLKKEYNTTWYTIGKIIESAGLELPKSDKWTDEEINRLKELSGGYHYKDIANMMGRPEQGIYLKAKRLGITLIQNGRKWTKDEEEYFKNTWGNKPVDEIAKELRRTVFSLKVKAIRMGLGSMLSNSDKLSISEVSEILNVTRDRIMNSWINKGLIIDKVGLGTQKEYYLISYDNLMEFLKNNPYEWDSRDINLDLLGINNTWIKDKQKWDEKNNPLFYRRWTDEEILTAIDMLNNGSDYKEIAISINRSDRAVGYMLRSLGYKLKEWKEYETEFLIDNYQDLTYQEIADFLNKSIDSVEYHITKEGLPNKRRILTKK